MKSPRSVPLTLLIVSALLIGGCGHKVSSADAAAAKPKFEPKKTVPKSDPKAVTFLKETMDRYAGFDGYQTKCVYSGSLGGENDEATIRDFWYSKPNRFKVVSSRGARTLESSVCNGKWLVDGFRGMQAEAYAAPAKISEAASMHMVNPSFCGTLLYQFFGGASRYRYMVDTDDGAVTFGPREKAPGGELAQNVRFYGWRYGHVEVLIGKSTRYVYRIKYDEDPLMQTLHSPGARDALKGMAKAFSGDPAQNDEIDKSTDKAIDESATLVFEEDYHQIKTQRPPASTFAIRTR